ncbi:MAG: hypothetical protein MJZ34_00260 [Paludibacteraceae bacterium]|nr:hypothetical protein [Paludibacteraceae bacterium]
MMVLQILLAKGKSGYTLASQGLNTLKNDLDADSSSITESGQYIACAILAIGLIYVVWSLATGKPHGKELLIGWIVAVIFSVILFK